MSCNTRPPWIRVKRAIIYCREFHALWDFLPYACHFGGVELLMVPTASKGIGRGDWYMTEKGYQKVLGEVAKCGVYFKGQGGLLAK